MRSENLDADPGEAARVAAIRARTQVRLFVVANGLGRFATLTCEDTVAHAVMNRAMTRILRGVRRRAEPFPFLWVSERGETGALHIHALLGLTVAERLAQAWPLGFVDVRALDTVTDRRAAAEYVCKDFSRSRVSGCHRYHRARGFAPEAIQLTAPNVELLMEAVRRAAGPVHDARVHWTGPRDRPVGFRVEFDPPDAAVGPRPRVRISGESS